MAPSVYAPSYAFLYCTGKLSYATVLRSNESDTPTLTDRNIAWAGADSGFLPLFPLSPLPEVYIAWENAAAHLPKACRTGVWQPFISQIPTLSVNYLPDEHLPKANLCLGAIAHAIRNIAQLPVPDSVLLPWFEIANRLDNPSPSLPYPHLAIINFKAVSRTRHATVQKETVGAISDPWSQTEPAVSLTGSRTEQNFWHGTFCLELASRLLPGILVRAQQAVVSADNSSLRTEFINLIHLLDRMTSVLLHMDVRPLSKWCVDPIDFSRSVDAATDPVVDGEKTGSGTQSPLVHILDAFFERCYQSSRLAQIAKSENSRFPRLHRDLIGAVRKISVFDYIDNLRPSREREHLLNLYMRALTSFADDSGFLGKHRLRLIAFAELGTKIGRKKTASALALASWKDRIWFRIDATMEGVRLERMHRCRTLYHPVYIQSTAPVGKNSFAHRVVFHTDGAVVYQPGDVFCIMPENREVLAAEILSKLNVDCNRIVHVKTKPWILNLLDRGFEKKQPSIRITIAQLLRFASLQKLNFETLRRLQAHLKSALSDSDDDGVESILQPLQARSYSIASSAMVTPNSIEILVGKTEYIPLAEEVEQQVLGTCSAKQTSQVKLVYWTRNNGSLTGSRDNHENDQEVPQTQLGAVLPEKQKNPRVVQGASSSFLATSRPGSFLYARVIPKVRFRLPSEVSAPIVMIGLGTGIAPYMAFIREFVHVKLATGRVRQRAWLILGVRTPDHIPFREELEEAVFKHKVIRLSIAFSRADVELCGDESNGGFMFRPGGRKRVQNLLRDSPERLNHFWNMIADKGHVYICGKPQLEPFIRETITKAVREFGKNVLRPAFPDSADPEEALSYRFPYLLAAQHRLHMSTYNGGEKSKISHTVLPSEVAQHRSMSSCFVSFRGYVYNLTEFLMLHPGGAKILFDKAGRDITEDFNLAHGKDSNPIVAMVEPYRIGTLQKFPESCDDRILAFMQEWSLPLLHGVLEHRSAFLMEVNNFPNLELLQSNAQWTSQLSSRDGQTSICHNFWNRHERQLFEYIKAETSSERIEMFNNGCCTTLEPIFKKLQTNIICCREEGIQRAKEGRPDVSKPNTRDFLLECGEFMDKAVGVFVDVQRLVESALLEPTAGALPLQLHLSFSETVAQSITVGMRQAYATLPMDYLDNE